MTARRWLYPARLPDPRDRPDPVHDGDTVWLELLRVAAGSVGWPFEVETFRTRGGQDVSTLARFVAVVRVNPDLGIEPAELNADVEAFARAQGFGRGVGG